MAKLVGNYPKREKALLITVDSGEKNVILKTEDSAKELESLVSSCGLEIIDSIICHREKITPNLYIGQGKVEEIALMCLDAGINTVVFNNDLSGTHQRNLEEIINRKTIDRTQLILDIFARHAKSPEGKMQVELAQLEYLVPRLAGKGIMLSRLGGGIGTRGPGEQKLEVDRRHIQKRIQKLKKDLQDLDKRRCTMRKSRHDVGLPLISIVGYTNAGKSTLMNLLTHAGTVSSNTLFTTLDPLARKFKLPNNQRVIFSDTVGFIDRLPHNLIEAFKATLEEVRQADLLIHVLDISDSLFHEHNIAVYEVLKQLGADQKPVITALNKIDKIQDRSWFEKYKKDFPNAACISALKNENIAELADKIINMLSSLLNKVNLVLPINRMDLVDKIYKEGLVLDIKYTPEAIHIKAILPSVTAGILKAYKKDQP